MTIRHPFEDDLGRIPELDDQEAFREDFRIIHAFHEWTEAESLPWEIHLRDKSVDIQWVPYGKTEKEISPAEKAENELNAVRYEVISTWNALINDPQRAGYEMSAEENWVHSFFLTHCIQENKDPSPHLIPQLTRYARENVFVVPALNAEFEEQLDLFLKEHLQEQATWKKILQKFNLRYAEQQKEKPGTSAASLKKVSELLYEENLDPTTEHEKLEPLTNSITELFSQIEEFISWQEAVVETIQRQMNQTQED